MTQPLPWEKNVAVPVPPAPEPVPLDAYTVPAAPEPELVPLDIYDAPAPAPKPAKPLVDIDSLNPAQREAVLTTEGPLLVLAGAGSGKTRVLTFRIAHMLGDLGVKPWQILAITFTNKAAAEMRERLAALIPSGTRGMWVCTFHAMCVRMLREDADLLGYTGQFTIYDDDDSKRMVRDIMQALGIEQKQFPINMIRSKISSAKNAMIGPEDMLKSADSPNDKKAAQVYLELERRLRAANAMDFDDLLVRTLELLRTRPEVLDKYQERFRYISVDEYQDTNHVQYEIANLLAAKYQNLMVVGDDDQSIYSWRGADITNILDFEQDFKNCKTVKLEQNYRGTTRSARTSACLRPRAMARRSRPSRQAMSATRAAGLPARSRSCTPRARVTTTSPCSTAPTLSRVFSKICSCAQACPTRSWVARDSSTVPRSATSWPILR